MEVYCTACHSECWIKPLDLSFSYAGTHCTGGKAGIHYPSGHGELVSNCCEEGVKSQYGSPYTQSELADILHGGPDGPY